MTPNDEIFAAQEKLFSAGFDKARAYSQIVSGIGYAGIFAAWTFTKQYLTRGEIFWSAFLACLSIAAFVLFEVFTTFITSRMFLGLARALEDRSKFLQVIAEREKEEKRLQYVYSRAWAVLWPFSFVTGVAAAGILLGAFIGNLLTLP
jgi:hypothetical protein